MKIRQGFVSNSSSCSFTCVVCNHNECGSDSIGPEEYGFSICSNGHTICYDCLVEPRPKEPDVNDINIDNTTHTETALTPAGEAWIAWADETEEGSYVPERCCPVCSMIVLDEKDLHKYFKKLYNVEENVVFAEIKKYNNRRKKLYDSEYNLYVMKKEKITDEEIVKIIKEKFSTYADFKQYLRR